MKYFYLITLISAVISLRALPSIFRTERYAADEAFHIYLVDEIRRNNHRIPDKYDQLLPPASVHYPSLTHWIASFLPKTIVVAGSPYFGVFVDIMHFFLILIPAGWIFSEHTSNIPIYQAIFITGVIFALTPKLVTGRPLTARLRLGGRAPGALLLTCSVVGYMGWIYTGEIFLIITSVVAAAFIGLTSSFGTQTLILLYVFLSIIFVDITPLIILLCGGFIATLVSSGRYLGMLRAHIGTLLFYYDNYEKKRAERFKNRIKNTFHFRRRVESFYLSIQHDSLLYILKNRSLNLCEYVYKHDVIGAYLQLPFILCIPLLLILGHVQNIWRYLMAWVLILLFLNAIIAIPGVPGKPAHRYTEYLVAPLSVLGAYAYFIISGKIVIPLIGSISLSLVLGVTLCIYSLGAIFINSIVDILVSPPADLSCAVDFLAEIDEQSHIYAIPGTYGKRVLPDTNHVQMQCIHDHFITSDGRCECANLFNSPNEETLQQVHERFEIDYILGDIQKIDQRFGEEFEQLFTSGEIGVYAYETNADQ